MRLLLQTTIVIACLLAGAPFTTSSQGILKRLKDRAASSAENAVGNKISKKIVQTISQPPKGKKKDNRKEDSSVTAAGDAANTPPAHNTTAAADTVPARNTGSGNHAAAQHPGAPGVTSYSRYDFIPGQTVLFQEDFASDAIGEFPLKWFTGTKGETVTLDAGAGKWLRMYNGGNYAAPVIVLKDNYTIEFDLLMDLPKGGYKPSKFTINFFDNGQDGASVSEDFIKANALTVGFSPDVSRSYSEMQSFVNNRSSFKSPAVIIPDYYGKSGKPIHFAINIQQKRFRLWIDEQKVYDAPSAVPVTTFNQLRFDVSKTIYAENETAYFITNLRYAAGAPDMRSKLLTEGKLVTTAIGFDVNSDRIKPTSYPVLKEIAAALKDAAAGRYTIIGHTDADGDAAANMVLSEKRADAVKKFLTAEFGIAADRLETKGMGETSPVDKQNTPEAKANNRRVEILRQ